MSTRRQERLEKIQRVLSELCLESAKGTPIVVEGKKDCDALRELGLVGPVLQVKAAGKSFAQTIHEIEKSGALKVVLLLDFDWRGKQGTRKLLEGLERSEVKIDLAFWRSLRALAGREIQCVESLTSYLATLEKKTAA